MRYQRTIQPKPHKQVVRTTCDVCGEEIRPDYGFFDQSEVTMEARLGNFFPESDNRIVHEIDCCPKCFLERVKPALERELGVKFRERDADDFDSEAYAVTEEPGE